MWRAVFAMTRDREIANDAVAEAFAQCIRRGAEVRDPKAWVWRAAFKIAAGELKRRTRIEPSVPDATYEIAPFPAELIAALAILPYQQRAAMLLRHYAGYDTREVARILGITQSTVRVHLSRGTRRLRGLLEEKP